MGRALFLVRPLKHEARPLLSCGLRIPDGRGKPYARIRRSTHKIGNMPLRRAMRKDAMRLDHVNVGGVRRSWTVYVGTAGTGRGEDVQPNAFNGLGDALRSVAASASIRTLRY